MPILVRIPLLVAVGELALQGVGWILIRVLAGTADQGPTYYESSQEKGQYFHGKKISEFSQLL